MFVPSVGNHNIPFLGKEIYQSLIIPNIYVHIYINLNTI